MMRRLDPSVVAEIKSRLRIEDIVGRYVRLRRVGQRLVGPCPFHQETKPSFSVNPEDGLYYCFGCQAAGDLIEFYRTIHGLDFPEAVAALAEEAGIELAVLGSPNSAGPSRKRLLEMHAMAVQAFREALSGPSGTTARQYVQRRGIAPSLVESFALGCAPAQWDFLWERLRRKGYSIQEALAAGLVNQKDGGRVYDRFRGRLMFPIWNLSGQVIAFGGRALHDDDGPKYLNSPETPLFTKGDHLYGLYQARQAVGASRRILLTEGYVDVLALHQFGFPASCGVLGTALTGEQVRRLSGFVQHVDLVLDGDTAGRKAAFRSAEMLLVQGLSCAVVQLPDGEDIDSFLRSYGSEAFEELCRKAIDGLDYCVEWVRGHHSPAETTTWAVGTLRAMQRLELQAFFIPRLAGALGLSEIELRRALGRRETEQTAAYPAGPIHKGTAAWRDRELLSAAILFPHRLEELKALGIAEALATSRGQELWRKISLFTPENILAHLDAGEKAFFVQVRMHAAESGAEEIWESVCCWLQRKKKHDEKKRIQQALAAAQKRGDRGEELRLLALLGQMQTLRT
jgi:DNA primase